MALIERELSIVTIKELFELKLAIPEYQRPYSWSVESTNTLFMDIYEAYKEGLSEYRLGSVILHKNNEVYNIVDENSYQNVKNDMYNKFSSEMQKEIFPTVNYSGLPLHTMETKVIRIIGTNNGYNEKNTFLLEYNLTGINYDQDITNLIDIEDGVITRVIRVK